MISSQKFIIGDNVIFNIALLQSPYNCLQSEWCHEKKIIYCLTLIMLMDILYHSALRYYRLQANIYYTNSIT